jgi:hypothetical protein
MLKRTPFSLVPVVFTAYFLMTNCATRQNSSRIDYQMGERVTIGPLTYNVIETSWRSQLGNQFKVRIPEQRFLMITISVTNGGSKEISVPLLSLENGNGQSYPERENGDEVPNWFGVLRTLNPAQTQQGRIVFDVPLSSYRLRVTDGGEAGSEKYVWVEIPLRMDSETGLDAPGLGPVPPPTPGR